MPHKYRTNRNHLSCTMDSSSRVPAPNQLPFPFHFLILPILLLLLLLCPQTAHSYSHAALMSSSNTSASSSSASSSSSLLSIPRFVHEPPSRVHFLNDTGAVIQCQVASSGRQPLRVWWVTLSSTGTTTSGGSSSSQLVTDIHGLRHVRPNGDLVIAPFGGQQFRQDVHAVVSSFWGPRALEKHLFHRSSRFYH